MTEPVLPSALEMLVERYIALRDRKAQLKKKFDEDTAKLDEAMDKAERFFLGHMQTNGLTSLPTKFGTPYRATRKSVTVSDPVQFKEWLHAEPERYDAFVDLKANKTSVESYKEEHQDLPPGISWSEEVVVNVKRK